MNTNAQEVVAQIAAEADRTRHQPMPADAPATKPNKSVSLAVRIRPEDMAAIEAVATKMDIPVSAVVRGWILAGLASHREESLASAIERIAADVQRLREIAA